MDNPLVVQGGRDIINNTINTAAEPVDGSWIFQ